MGLSPAGASAQERPRPGTGDTAFVVDGDTVPFVHARHTGQECLDCHATEDAHGAVTVSTIRDCRSCHHEGRTAEPCAGCHQDSELEAVGEYAVPQRLVLSVDATRDRDLPFSHSDHASEPCGACHAEGPDRSAAALRCADCHDEHHAPISPCLACHREAAEGEHPLAVHATCTGSGCHDPSSTRVTAATMAASDRSVCLACHRDQIDHRPGERCARCHLMPRAEPGRGR